MKYWIFTYGALMSPARQQELLGRIPKQYEFVLLNYVRVWDLAIPYESVDLQHDAYIPENLPVGTCPTYFNIAPMPDSYVIGKVLEISEEDFMVFDCFEDVGTGFMQRIQIGNIWAYIGCSKFQQYFIQSFQNKKVFLPKNYFNEVRTAIKTLSTPIHPADCLISLPFESFLR